MRPPATASVLLRRWLHAEDRDELIGDLDEQYARRRAGVGRFRAALWYWREGLGLCLRQRWRRRRQAVEPLPLLRRHTDIWMDLRYGLRLLSRSPKFAIAAMMTLALTIAATMAVFAVAYGVLLRPIPVRDESSLAVLYMTRDGIDGGGYFSFPVFQAWQSALPAIDLAGISPGRLDITGPEGAERIAMADVTENFFRVLGVSTALGRLWTTADRDAPEIPAVISDRLWRRRYGADPDVIGRVLTAGHWTFRVTGVMPPRFERWRGNADLWAPIERMEAPDVLASTGYLILTPIVRQGTDPRSEAIAPLLIATASQADDWFARGDRSVRVAQLRQDVSDPRTTRIVLAAISAVVLTWVVACANIAALVASRTVRRRDEFALRVALGASRWRMARQAFVESATLAVPPGVGGVLLAWWAARALATGAPTGLVDASAIAVDVPVLLSGVGVVGATTIFVSLWPVVATSANSLRPAVSGRRRWSNVLVGTQVAAAVAVLVAALLLTKSLGRIEQVPLGFDARDVLSARVVLPTSRFGTARGTADARYLPAQQELLQRVAAIPGIEAVTLGGIFAAGSDGRGSIHFADGRRLLNGEPRDRLAAPAIHVVGPGYSRVYRARIVAGRDFTIDDHFGAPRVVIVNETMARLHWPGRNPIGERVNFGRYRPKTGFDEPWAEVIGVVADIRHGGVTVPPRPDVYRAALQYPLREFDITVRAAVSPSSLLAPLRNTLRAFDPDLLILAFRQLDDVIADANAPIRYSANLISGLAAITTGLCGFGVFGLLAQVVVARRREIGIRVALGASQRRVAAEMTRRIVWTVFIGLGVGAGGAWMATRSLEALLYEVAPRDPGVFATAGVVIAAIALLAAYVPARRAARIDPVTVLRHE